MPPDTFRTIQEDQAEALARDEILSPARERALVALTTSTPSGEPWLDPEEIAGLLAGRADVVVIATGDATWALSSALPDRLDVYGGAVRIWWPGVTFSSRPEDHPLLFIYSERDVAKTKDRLLRAILGDDAPQPAQRPERPAAAVPRAAPVLPAAIDATVVCVEGSTVTLEAQGQRGVLGFADLPVAELARHLRVGQTLRVRRDPGSVHGSPVFTSQGLLPGAWDRVFAEYAVGDMVHGRVHEIRDKFVLVEILPGARGLVPIHEIDYTFVQHPRDFVELGRPVGVQILDLDTVQRRATLSIKRAFGGRLRPPIALVPGGVPFAPGESEEAVAAAAERDAAFEALRGQLESARAQAAELAAELAAVSEDRLASVRRVRELSTQLTEARKELRSVSDRHEAVLRRLGGELDPASSERAFLLAVRLSYARQFGEGDREEFPLGRMRVGGEFLDRLRGLQGVSIDKVIEVCAQVASGQAHRIPSREVHQLRHGEGGAPTRVRERDGAKAWRCSLQDNTPSARRLHWWAIPGDDAAVIEFASVGVHDDVSIPD